MSRISLIHLNVRDRQLSLLSWLFLVLSAISCTDAALFDGCDHEFKISAGYAYLESPYYPNYYPAGTSCRYKFVAPLDYNIQVNCTISLNKNGNACSTEFFYIARDGDSLLRGSEQFCGNGTFTRDSLFRSVTLAYVSYGSWGRFRCSLYAKPQACDCGWSANTRIVNGVSAGANEFPSMVALKDKTSSTQIFCAGSIISHRHILTAAHCTQQQPNPANILAIVGTNDLSSTTSSQYTNQLNIQQIIQHPNYVANPVANDIAILVTSTIIEWSRGVGPICLPPQTSVSNTFAYQPVDVIGWGTTSFGGPTSSTLQKVSLQILDNYYCQKNYQGTANIASSQICTYDSTGNGRDSCQFDSGGPVILRQARQFLLGCISFGKICGQGGYATGVNTRITSFLTWIYQNTEYSTCQVSM